jgi:putative membrane protein
VGHHPDTEHGGMMDGGMMDMMSGMMGAWMVLWTLLGLAVLALIVVATLWLAKRLSPTRAAPGSGAEEVLRRRYAAGEITEEEFRRMRGNLSQH